jgi:hypothetical protein
METKEILFDENFDDSFIKNGLSVSICTTLICEFQKEVSTYLGETLLNKKDIQIVRLYFKLRISLMLYRIFVIASHI